ncbi:MAG: TonB-dependent receptor [Methylophilaceae bacterium]
MFKTPFISLAMLSLATLYTAGTSPNILAAELAENNHQESVNALSPIVVTATRSATNSFDVPAAIDSTDAEAISAGQLKFNLSESAARVPGVVVNNRNNPAQDLAIQIRGFGARSAFGVRGVRLYADGIPLTMPDGQGQTGTFNLDTAARVEYLRGPFSALYGNSSGGVVQIFTRDGATEPTLDLGVTFGDYDTRRVNTTLSGTEDNFNYIINAAHEESTGYREQSAGKRETLHSKLKFKLNDDATLTLVGTYLDQSNNQDPQGLTLTELKANRRQAAPAALQFNTRVTKRHAQVGAALDYQFTADDALRLMVYGGQRDNEQYLSTSILAQSNPSVPSSARNGGGVSVIDRTFGGIDLRLTHQGQLINRPYNVTAGLNYDLMSDQRSGYENFIGTTLGVKGKLRRDETNDVSSFDQYIQTSLELHPRFTVNGGVRHSLVSFNTKDRYIVGINKDDSGAVSFAQTTPVVGALFKLTNNVHLFANAGESFETPTFVEMGYNPDTSKSGLNLDLKPAQSRNYELGAKAFAGDNTLINLTLFKIDTNNEIVVASSQNGRTTYRNVPSSARKGLELSVESQLPENVRLYLAYTLLDAKFTTPFSTCKTGLANGTCTYGTASNFETIASGSLIPGTYRHTMYGEVSWKHAASGFTTALEMRHNSRTNVSFNARDGYADDYVVVNWRGGFNQNIQQWKLSEFVRIENLFNENYVGSIRVADSNQRFYEASPTRNWLIGVNASYRF